MLSTVVKLTTAYDRLYRLRHYARHQPVRFMCELLYNDTASFERQLAKGIYVVRDALSNDSLQRLGSHLFRQRLAGSHLFRQRLAGSHLFRQRLAVGAVSARYCFTFNCLQRRCPVGYKRTDRLRSRLDDMAAELLFLHDGHSLLWQVYGLSTLMPTVACRLLAALRAADDV